MPVRIHNVVIDCADPEMLADFWAAALGYERRLWRNGDGAVVFDPQKQDGVRLLIGKAPEGKTGKNRVHIDIEATDGTQQAEVKRLEGLGARVVEVVSFGTDRWGRWMVMQDPEGNEFSVGP